MPYCLSPPFLYSTLRLLLSRVKIIFFPFLFFCPVRAKFALATILDYMSRSFHLIIFFRRVRHLFTKLETETAIFRN